MDMAAPIYYTAEMVRALPEDGNRYEVVYGELLVTPAPRLWHQELTMRLLRGVGEYLDHEPVGHLLPSPADISWGSDVLVQPDLFVAPLDQVRTLDWRSVKDLLLVIEVLSPSSTRADSRPRCTSTLTVSSPRAVRFTATIAKAQKIEKLFFIKASPQTVLFSNKPSSRMRKP